MDSPTTLFSLSDTLPVDQSKIFTSTPTKSREFNASVDLSPLEQTVDTSYSENVSMANSLSSNDSSDSKDIDLLTMSTTMIIEEFKILPSRVWKDK